MPNTPRKKKVRLVEPVAKFSSVRLLVIVKQPSRHQSRWTEIVGSEVRVAQKSEVRRIKDDLGEVTHVVCDVEWDRSFGRVVSQLAQERHVVSYDWFREALNSLDADELPDETKFTWLIDQESAKDVVDEETKIFSKYACQRPTLMDHGNRRVVSFLIELASWWEYGTLSDEEETSYSRRVAVISKIISLIKVWPVELNEKTWHVESKKLLRQYHISDSSTSKSGGWISLLEAVSLSKRVERDDAYWNEDPKRRVVRELRMLKCGIGRKTAVELCERGVTSASDLVARRNEVRGLPETRVKALSYAPVGPSATPMDERETELILKATREATPSEYAYDVVGSYRRGKIGGHDLDILLTAPGSMDEDERKNVFPKFVERLTPLIGTEVFEVRGIGHGVATKSSREKKVLSVHHIVIRSPVVPGAFRHVDVVLSPASNYAHALLGWSGSRNFQRSLREYASRCHQKNWEETSGREVKGIRGWNLLAAHADDDANEESSGGIVYGRRLRRDEHWHWSQSGISICTGASTSKQNPLVQVYEEDSSSFRTEKDIFDFFHLDFRPPEERCA